MSTAGGTIQIKMNVIGLFTLLRTDKRTNLRQISVPRSNFSKNITLPIFLKKRWMRYHFNSSHSFSAWEHITGVNKVSIGSPRYDRHTRFHCKIRHAEYLAVSLLTWIPGPRVFKSSKTTGWCDNRSETPNPGSFWKVTIIHMDLGGKGEHNIQSSWAIYKILWFLTVKFSETLQKHSDVQNYKITCCSRRMKILRFNETPLVENAWKKR